ncbi:MAG: alpha/beta fold hydrolase [Sporocytophaga sp.]|uniref:alpha/beta fold hydrolase n=1 Tax=Sporocytophaga sp. TaxID=2231183 RepID=UPI001B2E880B|nr:alpha/beta fold hydrolase [Sporocytophaga sp.]MBO9703182.1 alpha/beta fold hydrolase [Sporocytophaga sp.]
MTKHWLDTIEYPFTSNYFDINGHKIHYIDEGQGETILFIHGTPSWSFDFRNVIKKLKSDFRCIAIDHIGFGLSDKPEHYDYSPQNHSKTLERFVIHKGLQKFALVMHDFGGPISLNFAIKHPEKISNIIILNSWLWSSKDNPEFIKLSKILKSPILPLLYRYLNFSPRYILPESFGDHKLPKYLLKQYTKPFANRTQRNGTVAFARSLLHDQNWFQELWNKRQPIADKLTLFIWGMKDPIITPKYLDKFSSGFTNSKIIKLETCGHFPQEEQSEIVAQSIFEFLRER